PSPPAIAPGQRRSWISMAVATLAIAAIGFAAYRAGSERPSSDSEPVEFTVTLPGVTKPLDSWAMVSPDGRRLAYAATPESGREPMIWIRNIASSTPTPLAGTEGVAGPVFWSPDGRHLGFRAGGRLKRVPVDGGPVQVICPLTVHLGATWG